ncbi:tRNA (adenosine(37)-N6)-dimethylallyltransferase MiaA [Paenibacillus glufosinatiresistens]|uniref:tRNA (adenosine(37)-N6)-dimethylallyltransferase MiaA n=1 Tax=Paenibacillus glufosinatiresistens TaxID=3070657 RepID=UPI00286E6DEC|nr:tRNA (adenosine(37)-N6)-dimethylallyltransferase MiaA [Paenibacillus sp. YX.27]
MTINEDRASAREAPQPDKPRLLVLVGPTAVGKTKLSVALAKAFNCEIISGDSMQVYRGMDIGTAKIRPEEMDGVPHHLIDIRSPDEPYSAADFQTEARQRIAEITERGRLPFIVGGTGLYIESLCYHFHFSSVSADEAFRDEQERFAEEHGNAALHGRLAEADPAAAARLHPNDRRRVIRALEIALQGGQREAESLAGREREPLYDLCLLGLTMDRQMLYNRIEDRIDEMLEEGLEDEVGRLLSRGYERSLPSMQGLGYKEIAAWLQGETTREEAVALLKRDTRRFAKRQLSWFRHMRDIHWIDVSDGSNFSGSFADLSAIIAGKFR